MRFLFSLSSSCFAFFFFFNFNISSSSEWSSLTLPDEGNVSGFEVILKNRGVRGDEGELNGICSGVVSERNRLGSECKRAVELN